LVCIAVLFAAYGIGLGIKEIRFARIKAQASAATETEKSSHRPGSTEDQLAIDTDAGFKPSVELAEEPFEEPAEKFADRLGEEFALEFQEELAVGPEPPEGERLMGGELGEGFQYMSEEVRARMQLEARRAEQDRQNYRYLQQIWPTLSEQQRDQVRDIQQRWSTMSEEERDYYRDVGANASRRAEQDRANYRYIQQRWPTMSEQERNRIRDIQQRWPTMSEEERDYYRAGNF
jgi:hypothetical protein